METFTLEKPDGTKFQVNAHPGKKFACNSKSCTCNKKVQSNKKDKPNKPLPPTGITFDDDDKKVVQSNKSKSDTPEPLYPLGVNIE